MIDKPEVTCTSPTTRPYTVLEGETATLECRVAAANPNISILWTWFKTDSRAEVLYDGPTFTIPNIKRNRSGSYSCLASNVVGTSQAVMIDIDVQYEENK